jgi:hypothetical protein
LKAGDFGYQVSGRNYREGLGGDAGECWILAMHGTWPGARGTKTRDDGTFPLTELYDNQLDSLVDSPDDPYWDNVVGGAKGIAAVSTTLTSTGALYEWGSFDETETWRPLAQDVVVLDKVGRPAPDTAQLSFTDVRVPASNPLGEQDGQGFGQLVAQLPQERLIIGAQAVGGMRRAVDDTIAYTKSREAFGHSLFQFQNTAFGLAECATIAKTCQVFLDHCIDQHARGVLAPCDAAMAMYWLTDQQCTVIDRCVQLHGGYGYMREYLIARMYEDTRAQRIYAGANEVMKEIIARSL